MPPSSSFWNKVLFFSPGWPRTHQSAQDSPELVAVILPQLPRCYNYRCVLSYLAWFCSFVDNAAITTTVKTYTVIFLSFGYKASSRTTHWYLIFWDCSMVPSFTPVPFSCPYQWSTVSPFPHSAPETNHPSRHVRLASGTSVCCSLMGNDGESIFSYPHQQFIGLLFFWELYPKFINFSYLFFFLSVFFPI